MNQIRIQGRLGVSSALLITVIQTGSIQGSISRSFLVIIKVIHINVEIYVDKMLISENSCLYQACLSILTFYLL